MDDESSVPPVKMLMFLALSFSIGLLCDILACVIWQKWFLFIVVISYIFAPLPNLIFGRCGRDPLDASGRNFKSMGFFLTGFLLVTGFAIPSLIVHADSDPKYGALVLSLAGGLIIYGSLIAYIHFFHRKGDYEI